MKSGGMAVSIVPIAKAHNSMAYIDDLISRGTKLAESGDHALASKFFCEAISIDKNNSEAHFANGVCALLLKNEALGIKHFEIAAKNGHKEAAICLSQLVGDKLKGEVGAQGSDGKYLQKVETLALGTTFDVYQGQEHKMKLNKLIRIGTFCFLGVMLAIGAFPPWLWEPTSHQLTKQVGYSLFIMPPRSIYSGGTLSIDYKGLLLNWSMAILAYVLYIFIVRNLNEKNN